MTRFLIVTLAAVFFSGVALADWDEPFDPGHDTETYCEKKTPYYSGNCVFDPDTLTWTDDGSGYGKDTFTVTCDVELFLEMYFEATDVRFHIASPGAEYMECIVNGWIAGNNPECIFITKDGYQPEESELRVLVQESTVYGNDANDWDNETWGMQGPSYGIPVTWQYRVDGQGDFEDMPYSEEGLGGNLWGYYWYVDLCTHTFEIKIIIEPELHQYDGRYEMDPLIVASPGL